MLVMMPGELPGASLPEFVRLAGQCARFSQCASSRLVEAAAGRKRAARADGHDAGIAEGAESIEIATVEDRRTAAIIDQRIINLGERGVTPRGSMSAKFVEISRRIAKSKMVLLPTAISHPSVGCLSCWNSAHEAECTGLDVDSSCVVEDCSSECLS